MAQISFQQLAQDAKSSTYDQPAWANDPYQPPQDVGGLTQQAIGTYMYSKQPDGTMGGLGWGWQTANGYTALALHELWSGNSNNYDSLADAIKTTERNNSRLENEYNDDTLWWAMCCIHTYNIRRDQWFLDRARDIWQSMQNRHAVCRRGQVMFRGQDMEGACYWTCRDGEESINTITTGLYAEMCARLALIERGNDDACRNLIDSARTSLAWILRYRYRPADGIVLDGIMLKKDEEVDWTFTYVTGVAMGVCALLWELLGESEYLELALHMANRAMRNPPWVESHNGVLTESGAYGRHDKNPYEDNDAVGFKAVLMRQFGTVYDVLMRTRPDNQKATATAKLIKTFVNVNFQSQIERNSTQPFNGQLGPWWNGPFEAPTSHSQMAALDVMAVVRLVCR